MSDSKLSKVVQVMDEENVVLNVGEKAGIKKGYRFIIFGKGEELFDPDSNESLGVLELVRGEGVVVHVQEKMCIVRSDEYTSEPGVTEIKTYPHPLGLLTYAGSPVKEEKVIKPGKKSLIGFSNAVEGDIARLIK